MAETLAIGAADGARVGPSAVAIVAALLLLLRLLGQRSAARMTTFDVAVLLVLGVAGGRVITGHTPTLAAGLVAIIVLITTRALADRLARTRLGARIIRNSLILLVDHDRILAPTAPKLARLMNSRWRRPAPRACATYRKWLARIRHSRLSERLPNGNAIGTPVESS